MKSAFACLCGRIAESVDLALQLSETYKVRVVEFGHALVLFFFSTIISLIDSTLDDWGLNMTSRKRPRLAFGGSGCYDVEIDSRGSEDVKSNEHQERLRRMNSFFAIEVLGKLTESRKALVLLRLVHLNMYVFSILTIFINFNFSGVIRFNYAFYKNVLYKFLALRW